MKEIWHIDSSLFFSLAYRQLALKDSTSKSWYVSIHEILYRYGLPNAQELLDSPPEKLSWNVNGRRSVNKHWRKVIIYKAKHKSTLEFLNIASNTPEKVHPICTNCKYNANSLLKAYICTGKTITWVIHTSKYESKV